jgi:hypothetical protein
MNQIKPDVHCNKCNKIINREEIKKFLKEEEETEILKEFEERWTPEGKLFIFFFLFLTFFFIININRFSLEDIDKMKSGKCPYCNNSITQQDNCFKCEHSLCGRLMTFEDVEASMKHPSKTSQQKSSLAQSTVWGGQQTDTSYEVYNPPDYYPTLPSSSSPPSYSSSFSSPSSYFSSTSFTTPPTHPEQRFFPPPNKPISITVEHEKIDENIEYRGIYKPKFIITDGSRPTNAEQNAFNKLSDKDRALEYLLFFLFYFFIFRYTDKIMEYDKCIECNTDLKRIKFPKGGKEVIAMKCLNRNCSLCYVVTEVVTFDIGRWPIRGKKKIKKIINEIEVQVFFFLFKYINIII